MFGPNMLSITTDIDPESPDKLIDMKKSSDKKQEDTDNQSHALIRSSEEEEVELYNHITTIETNAYYIKPTHTENNNLPYDDILVIKAYSNNLLSAKMFLVHA